MNQIVNRIILIFRSILLKQKDEEPLNAFEKHVDHLNNTLNQVTLSLNHFKARETVLTSELLSAKEKLKHVDEKLGAESVADDIEKEQLLVLRKQYHQELEAVEHQLRQNLKLKEPVIQSHQELRKSIQEMVDLGQSLKGRFFAAKTSQALYGDHCSATSPEGISKVDALINRVKEMEALADAYFELAPTATKIDSL